MHKNYPESLFDELQLLAKFPEESHLEGIKVHSDADHVFVVSAKSLFNKGLITQMDGGYLTDRGRELSVHLHEALTLLANLTDK